MSGKLVDDRRERIQKMNQDAIDETESLINEFEEKIKDGKTTGYNQIQLFDQIVWINSERFLSDYGCDTGLRPQVLNGYYDLLNKSERLVKNRKNSKYFRAKLAETYRSRLYEKVNAKNNIETAS